MQKRSYLKQNESSQYKYRSLVVGNIPEVVISTARGRSPRAVLITNEGVFLQPRVILFVAMATVVADNDKVSSTQY